MLHLVIGNQGSGKTLFLVKKALEYARQGITIYSNINFKGIRFKRLKYKDIIECKLSKGVVFLDEIHLLINSRNSISKNSREICTKFLSQVRKQGLEIWASSQKPRKVDINFREETDILYSCQKFALINNVWSHVTHNQNLSKKVPIMIDIEVTEMYSGKMIKYNFIGNEYFKMYDTSQIIQIEGI